MFSRLSRPASSAIRRATSTATRATFATLPINDNVRAKFQLHWSAVLAGVGLSGFALYETRDTASACGIVGFVGEEAAYPYLMEGLTILQNRGYDSAGLATISDADGSIVCTKYASVGSTSDSIDLLKDKAPANHVSDRCGVAHTRWATHGGKTDENAHPHCDTENRVSLVHNGTIENANVLRKELQAKGVVFKSETDTEVIVQLVGQYLTQGFNTMDALKHTLKRLEGTWGIALISKDQPDTIIAARNGSPLLVGIGKGKMWVASEATAFKRHTNSFIALKDGEVAAIKNSGVTLDMSRVELAPEEEILLSPEPYPHWTIKEIMDQPSAVSRALKYGSRLDPVGNVVLGGLDEKRDLLLPIRHLLISACGTSYFAGQYGAKIMRQLKAFDTVRATDAGEVQPEEFPKDGGGLLVVSQSGETKDVHRTLGVAEFLGLPRFSVVNCVGSLIANTTNCGVYVHAGREQAVASTKAFITQVVCLSLISGWFAQNRAGVNWQTKEGSPIEPATSAQMIENQRRQELVESLHRLPTYVGMTLQTARPLAQKIALQLKDTEHLFVLGKGFGEPIAYEGALKIKEITYIHAEGYSGGALKHGPFALIEKGTPIIMLILDDKHATFMQTAAHEVRARGAFVIAITDKPELCDGIADEVIPIPSNGMLTALLGVLPLQMLAYELAVLRGINPDKPKNLAKAVTVD